jgi:hypothetical protein
MRAYRLLTAVAAAALLLAGCSDSSPSANPVPSFTTAPPTSVPTTDAPTATPTSASPTPDELSPKPSLESPAPLGQPVCKGSTLTVTDADSLVDPTSFREVFSVRTNGRDCQLRGYPTVTFQGANGRAVPVTVLHSGFGVAPDKPQPVTLSRSTSVSFEIGSARSGSCTSVTHVTVTLPGTAPGHRTSTQFDVCNGKAAVSPVMRRGDID